MNIYQQKQDKNIIQKIKNIKINILLKKKEAKKLYYEKNKEKIKQAQKINYIYNKLMKELPFYIINLNVLFLMKLFNVY